MSDFLSGVITAGAIMIVMGLILVAAARHGERERELTACRAKQGVLVAEVHGNYACINTAALHTWHAQ